MNYSIVHKEVIQQLRGQNFDISDPQICLDNFYTVSLDNNRISDLLHCTCALLMFCLLNPQTNACEPNPKTTSGDFNR